MSSEDQGKGRGRVADRNTQAAREHVAKQEATRLAEEAETAKADAEEKKLESNRKRVQHAITVITVVLAVCAFGVSIWQGYETKKGVDAQTKAMGLQYRPWLAVKHFDKPKLEGGPNDFAVWTMTNVGPVPAVGRFTAKLAWIDQPPTYDLLFPPDPPGKLMTQIEIPSSQELQLLSEMDLLKGKTAEIASVREGRFQLYSCILVFYSSPEVGDPEHEYPICAKYNTQINDWQMFVPPPKR